MNAFYLGVGKWRLGWFGVFVLNLVIPLCIGWGITERGAGRAGMLVGVAVMLLLGDGVCRLSRRGALILVYGGLVALVLIVMGLPVVAGLFALVAAKALGLTEGLLRFSNELGGLVATIVTGGLMILAGSCFSVLIPAGTVVQLKTASEPSQTKPGVHDRDLDF